MPTPLPSVVLRFFAACGLLFASPGFSGERLLDEQLHHLRSGNREWNEFPEQPEASHWEVRFPAERNSGEATLRLRQQDVKQNWTVLLNGQSLGKLTVDENDMVIYFPIPEGVLRDGENIVRIEQSASKNAVPDDIRVGEIAIDDRPISAALREGRVAVEVLDSDLGKPTPCRITIVRLDGALQTVGASSNQQTAVRPGLIYSSTGRAEFGLPAGQYRLLAGRGFEYSLDSKEIRVTHGDSQAVDLKIRREVPTEGYVACDTHIHTVSFSGHGDATIQERMVTLAGEGIELPVAADHNVHIDYEPFAREAGVRQYFTPVTGIEVTTKLGHFNVFPVPREAAPADARRESWEEIFAEIAKYPGTKGIILNHARDIHSATRPFGPKLHNAVVGENLHGWPAGFNAMEVVNSGATQTDPLRLFQDWMALLNRGRQVTPVGSSDSHDVGRHFVGQGRTYIRCSDDNPGQIDVAQAMNSFVQGKVRVSYGLIAELTVNGEATAGDVATLSNRGPVELAIRILAPHWITADRCLLFQNGTLVREWKIGGAPPAETPPGVRWSHTMEFTPPAHDVHLVAIALGPGVTGAHWKTAKPYQPTSADWAPRVIGCSGAVWLDVDGDGRATSAYDYAREVFAEHSRDLPRLLDKLSRYDGAVAAQTAHLFQAAGGELLDAATQSAVAAAAEKTRAGWQSYLQAWRETGQARVEP